MGFFREEKSGFQLPVLQAIDKSTEDVFDDDLAVDVACVFQVNDDGAAVVFGLYETLFEECRFGYVVGEES